MSDNQNTNSNQNANAAAKKTQTRRNNFFRNRYFGKRIRDTGPAVLTHSVQIPQQTNPPNNTNGAPFETPLVTPPTDSFSIANGKYPGWQLYFPEIEYKPDIPQVQKVQAFEQYIKRRPLFFKLNEIRDNFWFPLPLPNLMSDQEFIGQYPIFLSDLNQMPEETLLYAGLAAHQCIHTELPAISSSQLSGAEKMTKMSLSTIRARVQDHSPIVTLSLFNQPVYNRLVTVRGTAVRVNPVELASTWMAFSCSACGNEQSVRQTDRQRIIDPKSCKNKGCRARSNFRMLKSSPYTRIEACQTIRLQESVQSEKGQIPKTIEVDLEYDLVDKVYPGDDITVTGVMKVRKSESRGFSQQNASRGSLAGMHTFYLSANAIVSNKNIIAARNSEFSQKDLEMITSISIQQNLFKMFVHSLCPRIFGHEMVKAGLILSLFGGSGSGEVTDNNPVTAKRSEIHVLIVGDPGLGKSLLIQSCANVSPRGIFVCGNSTTNAGLTVSIRHDKSSDGSLEAGALLLADQGICCLDEFDKMKANYQSLLQVMEQQSISIAKAGVLLHLPARTTILAAANPSRGHYDKGKTVSENLKIWPTLLSRFDLVFILMDRADAHLDNLLTEHIMSLKQNGPRRQTPPNPNLTQMPSRNFTIGSQHLTPEEPDAPLYERLKHANLADFDPLPTEAMQKYIMYARKFCFPTLSKEATDELVKFYDEMRTTRQGIDSVPVTTRQLEALIRMAQARARIELAREATVEHVRDVIAILRYTMVDVLSTDQGTLQMNRSINGSGVSHATKVKRFLQILQSHPKNMYTLAELREIARPMSFESSLNQIIDSLNVQGFLIKRGSDIYRFTT